MNNRPYRDLYSSTMDKYGRDHLSDYGYARRLFVKAEDSEKAEKYLTAMLDCVGPDWPPEKKYPKSERMSTLIGAWLPACFVSVVVTLFMMALTYGWL